MNPLAEVPVKLKHLERSEEMLLKTTSALSPTAPFRNIGSPLASLAVAVRPFSDCVTSRLATGELGSLEENVGQPAAILVPPKFLRCLQTIRMPSEGAAPGICSWIAPEYTVMSPEYLYSFRRNST